MTTMKLPPTDTGACGTFPGYSRHTRKGEAACPACIKARAEYDAKRRPRKTPPKPASTQDPAPTRAEILEAETEFLLMCGEGEHAVVKALGYDKPRSLKRQLARNGQHHLIPRIFSYQAEQTDIQTHSASYMGITRQAWKPRDVLRDQTNQPKGEPSAWDPIHLAAHAHVAAAAPPHGRAVPPPVAFRALPRPFVHLQPF